MALSIREIFNTLELLKAQLGDKLVPDTVLRDYIMQPSILNTVNAVHHYKISPYRGGYCTKVNNPTAADPKHRKLILGKSEPDIYLKLIEWYGAANIENLTLDDLYMEWKQFRIAEKTPNSTVVRDQQRYERYFIRDPFFAAKLCMINRVDLKKFCCRVIVGETMACYDDVAPENRKMTRKEWGSTKCILNGMFNYAVEMEYIGHNLLSDMTFPKYLFRKPPHKTAETEVFDTNEEQSLIEWCEAKFTKTHDLAYLLPVFNLEVGLRIGECVALTWDNWINMRHLAIEKSEYKDRETGELSVQNHTKTHNDRTVPLSKRAMSVLNRIKLYSQSDIWVFARDGKRLTSRQANYILEKYAKDNDLPVKSSHKLRKTFGSNLRRKGATPRQCADTLGNTEEVFLRCYDFNTATDDKLIEILDREIC